MRLRFVARRKIPRAAFGLKKYRAGTSSSSTSASEDEDPSPSLGNSEVSAVQHSPGEVVKPELGQRRKYDGEISSTVAGKKSGYVLNEDPAAGSNESVSNSGEFKEEARAVPFDEARSPARDREVLAGESSAEEVNRCGIELIERPRSVPIPPDCNAIAVCPVSPLRRSTAVGGDFFDVVVDGDSGESLCKDSSSPLVDLAEEDMLDAGAVEACVEASDS